MEENRPEDILEVTLDRLEQEGLWFTTKEDKIYANATNLYSLDEYGDLDDKSKERLIKEVLGYIGDGASFLIEAVNQWIDDNLIEGIVGYVDTLAMKFKVKEAVEETNAYEELGVDDLETTVAEEADKPEKEKKTESKKLQESDNEDIISKLNQLCKEFNPYGDKEKSNKVKNEVRDILQSAPDGTEMYRVGKETSSGWTSHGSYSNERTVLKKYEKQNGVWKMNGSTKSDINDVVLGILYNSGEFKTLEDAKAEAEIKKQDDRTSHRDIVNIDSEHGVSTNRVDYPNRKTESRATFYKGEDEKSVLHGAKLEKDVAYKVTEIEESKKITEKYHVMAYKRYEDGEIHEEEIDEFDERDLAEKYKKDFEQDFKDEGYMSLSVVSDLEMDDEDNSNKEYDEDYFEVTDGDRVIQISKEDGKWIDSDGNRYMGYLTPNDIMHYFKGFHIVNESKELKTEASEDYSKPIKVGDKWFRYNYKYSELEYITHPSNEHGPIEVIDSVGLSVENWNNKAEREAYIQGWIKDLDVIEDTMSKETEDEFGYLFPKRLQEISKGVDCMHYGYNGDDGYRYVFDNKSKMEKAKEYLGQFGNVTEVPIEDIIDYIDEDEYKKVKGCLMVKFNQEALEECKEEKVEENTKLEEDNDRDFDAFQKYIMDNVYCDSETLMTSPEIIEDNAGAMAEDAAKQVVNEILGETEYTGLYNSMVKDYEDQIKRIILNNIDKIVYLQNIEQEEVMSIIGEGKAKNLTEALNLLEKKKVQEVRVFRTLQLGDVYQNENGVKVKIIDITEDKKYVTLKFLSNGEAVYLPMENVNKMLDLNKYKKIDECSSVNFNNYTKDKLEEGVRQRLNERNEQSAGIIEQALAGITSETSDKESGIITKTSELFNSLSDRGYDVQVSFDNGESTSSISIGQQGANILITITDPEQPLRAFASGNFEINDDSIKMIKSIMEVLK